jgi:hypothetical protein
MCAMIMNHCTVFTAGACQDSIHISIHNIIDNSQILTEFNNINKNINDATGANPAQPFLI